MPKGGITARGFASNEINLNEGSTINLNNGEGIMDTSLDYNNKNLNGPHTQSILTFKGKDGTFNGKILSDGSNEYTGGGSGTTLTTYIKVDSNASGTITGDITQNNGGKNMIELGANGSGTNGNSTLTLKGSTNQIEKLTASASASTLILDSSSNKQNVSINNISSNNTISANTLNIDFKGDKGSVLSLGNNKSDLKTSTNGTINIKVESNNHSIINAGLNTSNGTSSTSSGSNGHGININFSGSNTSLGINGDTSKNITHNIAKLESTGTNNTLNLSGQAYGSNHTPARNHFQTLTINKIDEKNPINFILYVNPNASNNDSASGTAPAAKTGGTSTPIKADRIIIEGVNGTNGGSKTHYLAITGNAADIVGKELYKKGGNNIALATVKDTSHIKLQSTNTNINGFTQVKYEFVTDKTDKNGMVNGTNGYTTYFLGSAKNVTSNISKFALETNAFYTTIQGGYDYAFGFNGANNYLGVALSYANSITGASGDASVNALKGVNSNAVEFAIYNAYVQDGGSKATGFKNGLYNDTVLKFSYIHSGIEIIGQDNSYSTNNFAFTLSDEIGYRFILGQSDEWYIDPQAELAFGYLNQSNFKQIINNTNAINALQDSIFTLRGRVGSSFGYKFDKFTEGKNFKAEAYLGTYFVGDYITGGDITLTNIFTGISNNETLTPLNSTARFTLNLGTNIAIKDDHRIYFDFERSFGGSIITQYQFNLGYRYSFGESKYTPYSGVSMDMSNASDTIKEVAPTQGYYIEVLTSKKASKKELRVLKGINNLKTQNVGDSKSYLIGPFKSVDEAKNEKNNYEGVLKELGSEGEIIEVE